MIYHAYKKLMRSRNLSKRIKISVYKTIIRPTLIYATAALTLTNRREEELSKFERITLRFIPTWPK